VRCTARPGNERKVPRSLRRGAALLIALATAATATTPARADRQRDPGLKPVVQAAMKDAPCFDGKYDDVVWYGLMQPRVERRLQQRRHEMRLGNDPGGAARRILAAVHCEARKHRHLEERPQLLLAVIDVESAFDPFAVSSAGAVGLMQVMPFWPTQLGLSRRDLINVEMNIRMGAAILEYYMRVERGDYRRALARYNGSLGRRAYPDLVLARLDQRWRR
jgi:soluble lytic murein transglycosylase-like protein